MSSAADGAGALEAAIVHAVRKLSDAAVAQLAAAVAHTGGQSWPRRRAALRLALVQPAAATQAERLLAAWQALPEPPSAEALALAIRGAAAMEGVMARQQQLELAWTGPATTAVPLRHTSQVLLTLIEEAAQRLDLMSFAVYKVPQISEALVAAAQRGVELRIYLETPDTSQGKMAANTIRNLGPGVAERAKVYVWPAEKRRLLPSGYPAVLHAKLAVADQARLFVSSANLTGAALYFNMEMGVLILGGEQPGRVARHLDGLVEQGIFVPAPETPQAPALSPAQLRAWDEVLDYASEACRPLLEAALARGLEPPEVGYALVPPGRRQIVAEAELAWPARELAVLLGPAGDDRAAFERAGWQALAPEPTSAVLSALGA